MRKVLLLVMCLLLVLSTAVFATGCSTRESEQVSYNLSLEADNFNIVRQLTVINSRDSSILFQMTGKLSIDTDVADGQLEVTCEDENGVYHKHFIFLNSWTTYVVEDLGGADVNKYKYTLNFNPNMIVPYEIDTVD